MPSRDGLRLIEARGLERSFGRARILRGIDLTLDPGEVLAVIGPNGAGKTTLLRLLAGLIRPSAGEVWLRGERLTREHHQLRRNVGFLSHQSLLYDDLTLLENLTFAARLYGIDHPERTAQSALEAMGLAARGRELPVRLSRGLLQRAALARAMLHDPPILLLDEPFSGLDAAAADQLRSMLEQRLARGHGLILVTHDLRDAWALATRVAVLVEGRWAAEELREGPLESFLPRYHGLIGA